MFPPIQTGTSFYARNLAEEFFNKGHTVCVVATENSLVKKDNITFKIIRIPAIGIPLKNFFKHLRFCSVIPGNYKKINRIAKENSTDVILIINHYLDIAFPAIYAAKINTIPFIVSVGTQIQSNRKYRNYILRLFDRLIIGSFIFPFAKIIVSWDKEIERYIEEVHSTKTLQKSRIIPYGVNGNISEYEKHTHDYSLNEQIIGIGAVIDQRNYLHAVKIFSKLLSYYPHLVFRIIGHEYIEAPRKLAKELGIEKSIIFMGEIPHENVIGEISKSMFAMNIASGQYTGLGTASIETMLMGVPLVARVPEDLFGSDARLKDMENIIYTDGISVLEIVQKLITVVEDVNLRQKIGQNGKLFVEKHMNWSFVADKYISLFKEILAEKERIPKD